MLAQRAKCTGEFFNFVSRGSCKLGARAAAAKPEQMAEWGRVTNFVCFPEHAANM